MKTKILTLLILMLFAFGVNVYAEDESVNVEKPAVKKTKVEKDSKEKHSKKHAKKSSEEEAIAEEPVVAKSAEEPPVAEKQVIEKTASEKTASVQDLLDKMDQNLKKEEPVVAAAPVLALEQGDLSKQVVQSAANAANENSNILSQAKNREGLPWMKTLLATLFVSSLIVVVFLFVNAKGKNSGVFQNTKNQPMKLVQKLNLGLKTDVVLLEVEGSRLLLSVQASAQGSGVQLLQTLQGKTEQEEKPALSVQERKNTEFQILEELQFAKNQLHFESKEKLSSRVRDVVKKLSPLHAAVPSINLSKRANFTEDQNNKTLTATA